MIELLPAEEAEIAAVRSKFTEDEFNAWFDQSAIKARVKKACMQRQRLRCCYCRKFKDTSNSNEWDLEHILCKLCYPQFFASPANLAIACKQCNIAKSEEDVLRPQPRPDPRIMAVPAESERYSIPHPWVDDWHAHLSHVNYQIYSSETEKGVALIGLCKLNRIAVEDGGLSYDSVVAAIRANFFQIIKNPVETTIAAAEVLAHVAQISDHLIELQTTARLATLVKTLATKERAANRRTPEQAVAEARELARKSIWQSIGTTPPVIEHLVKVAPKANATPAPPAPLLALPPPDETEADA